MVSDFRIYRLILMGVSFLIVFAVACEKPTTKSGRIEKDTGPNRILPNQTEDSHVNNKKNRVSPYGFGPYPTLPNGWKDAWETFTPEDELAMRVWIQLLEQGHSR